MIRINSIVTNLPRKSKILDIFIELHGIVLLQWLCVSWWFHLGKWKMENVYLYHKTFQEKKVSEKADAMWPEFLQEKCSFWFCHWRRVLEEGCIPYHCLFDSTKLLLLPTNLGRDLHFIIHNIVDMKENEEEKLTAFWVEYKSTTLLLFCHA